MLAERVTILNDLDFCAVHRTQCKMKDIFPRLHACLEASPKHCGDSKRPTSSVEVRSANLMEEWPSEQHSINLACILEHGDIKRC